MLRENHIQSDAKQKLIAVFGTILVLLLCFLVMDGYAVLRRDIIREHYDDIDWTRFELKPVNTIEPEAVASNEVAAPSNEPLKRIDLSSLAPLLAEKMTLQDKMILRERTRNAASGTQKVDISGQLASLDNDFAVSINNNTSLLPALPGRRGKSSRPAAPGIETGTGSAQVGSPGGQDVASLGGIEGDALLSRKGLGAGTGGTVSMESLDDFGDDFQDFSEIYLPLLEWMKRHPAEFTRVEKSFMEYKPGNLTSRVDFGIAVRNFEMLLLCIEKTYEIRVALIESSDVTLLIDEGFTQKSHYLKMGKVDRRLADNAYQTFTTSLESPSNQRTDEFYQIFLSWWESVKHEVE